MGVRDFKASSFVARDEKGFIAIGHFIGGAVEGEEIAARIGKGSHPATAASASRFGNGRRFALEGYAFVGRASNEHGTVGFALFGVGARQSSVPGDIDVTLR